MMTLKQMVPWKRKEEGMTVRRQESPFEMWRSEMDRLFDRALSTLPMGGGISDRMSGHLFPDVDVKDADKEVKITAELPGVKEKDLTVTIDEGGLMLRGEKREEREEEKADHYLAECSYGSFFRQIPLPDGLLTDDAKAKFKDGVLKITIPKSPDMESKRKALKIEVE